MENSNIQNEDLIKEKEQEINQLDAQNETFLSEEQQIQDEINKVDEEIKDMEQNNAELKKMNKRRQRLEGLMDQSKDNLNSLTKDQLEEIENYKNPPIRIKKALEVIFLLLEGKVLEWDVIKKKLNQGTFVQKMMKFNINKVKFKTIKKVKKDYIDQDDWNMEKLKRASRAMGPLGTWLETLNEQMDEVIKKKSAKQKKAEKDYENLKTKKKKLKDKQKILENKKEKIKKRKTTINKYIEDIKNGNIQCLNCLKLEEELIQYKDCENCIYFYQRIQEQDKIIQKKNDIIKDLRNCQNCLFIEDLLEDAQKQLKNQKDKNFQLEHCSKCDDLKEQLQQLQLLNQDLELQLKQQENKKQQNEEVKESISQSIDKNKECQNCQYFYEMYQSQTEKQKIQIQKISEYKNCQNCQYFYDMLQNQQSSKSGQQSSNCSNCQNLQEKNNTLKDLNQQQQLKIEQYKQCQNCLYIYSQLEKSQQKVKDLQNQNLQLIVKQNILIQEIEMLKSTQINQYDSVQKEKKFQSKDFIKIDNSNKNLTDQYLSSNTQYKFQNVIYVNASYDKNNQPKSQQFQPIKMNSNTNFNYPQSQKQYQNQQHVHITQSNKFPLNQGQKVQVNRIPKQNQSNVVYKQYKYPGHQRSHSSNINASYRQYESKQKKEVEVQSKPISYIKQTKYQYNTDNILRSDSTLAYHKKGV